jgi:hypothetical protein
MSRLIVGKFDNQFAAASASAKLLSRGLQHSHIVSYADESVGNSAASSSVPTSIISRLGEAGEHHHKSSELRSPSQLPAPAMMGHTVLTVDPADDVSADEVRHVMELAGVAPGQLADSVKAGRNDGQRRAIGLQIPLITGEQEAALAGLRVLGAGQDFIERRHRLLRLDDLEVVVPDGLDVLVGHQAADHEKDNDGNQGQRRSFFGASTVQRS